MTSDDEYGATTESAEESEEPQTPRPAVVLLAQAADGGAAQGCGRVVRVEVPLDAAAQVIGRRRLSTVVVLC